MRVSFLTIIHAFKSWSEEMLAKMYNGLRKIFIATLYCLGVLVFFEATTRGVLSSYAGFRLIVRGHDDTAWRLRFIRLQSGKSRNINDQFVVYHPIRGWTLPPGLSRVGLWNNKTLHSNSRGLRGSTEHAYERPPGVLRILTFGDSFTFGEEVSDNETFSYDLEKLLPNSEVINFGMRGYGHDQMLLYLQEEGVKYHPDIVILGFRSLNMERNVNWFVDYAKPRFVLDGGQLVPTNTPVPRVEEILAREFWRSKFLDVLTMLRDEYRERFGALELKTEMEQVTAALLDEFVNTTRAAGAIPIFVYLPYFDEITRPEMDMIDGERFFLSYCHQRGVHSIDLHRFFHEKLERGVALTTGQWHWGPEEHRIAAEGIRAYLLEHDFVRGPQG
jgi:hypothetical protein